MFNQNVKFNITYSEKLSILRNLSILLGSGIPIVEAVDSLLEDTSGNQRKILTRLKVDLMQGQQIAATLSNFPKVFDKVTVNLIKAAEEAGTLETTLRDLQAHVQKEIELFLTWHVVFFSFGLIQYLKNRKCILQ